MKTFVINLDSRSDRLEYMREQLKDYTWERFPAFNGHHLTLKDMEALGFKPYREWKDPLLNRPLTITEIATAISHYKLWEMSVELDEPILILEDDSKLIGTLNFDELESLAKHYDIIYLDHKEMFEDEAIPSLSYKRPYYPYWNNAYVITPGLAQSILSSEYKLNLFPVDELFPMISGVNYNKHCLGYKDQFLQLKKLFSSFSSKPIAFTESIFKQMPRKLLGSDIENGKLIMQEKVHVLTVATDESKMSYLQNSANKFGIELVNIGKGVEWEGGTMQGPGGGHKLTLVREYVSKLPVNDIVLFVDGYDVFINDELETIVERFKGFSCDVLFAAEKTCWPNNGLASFFKSETEYKYLNSGCYIGYAGTILALTSDYIRNSEDDQLFLQKKFIEYSFNHKDRLKLDTENYVFQCLASASMDIDVKKNKQLINIATKCCPCILHGNGGEASKKEFIELYKKVFGGEIKVIEFEHPGELNIVAPDILEVNLLTPGMCKKLIDLAESKGKWESMYGDKFPAQEMRIRELDKTLFEQLEEHLKNNIYPLIEAYWRPLLMYGLRDAFIIKYSPETQASLKCHHDASLVSGNIKLNSDYTGGDTYFYRQNYSNINTPVGKMVLWPGQVTHGHEGREVTSGTKYNLVIWTSRRPGDINY